MISMNVESLREINFNEYIDFFNKGETIYSTTRLKQSYTAKLYNNLLLVNEIIELCKTYEENECKQHPSWYCGRVTLDDVLIFAETKTHKKVEFVKKFTKEDICNIINNYIFLLK